MNKVVFAVLVVLIFISGLNGQNYVVYGAGDTLANGLYTEMGMNEGCPWYKKGNYFMFFTQYIGCMPKWAILKDSTDMIYKNYESDYFPPDNFWQTTCNLYSVSPPPVVLPEGCAVLYSHEYITYEESILNNGSIDNSNPLLIKLNRYNGETFTGNIGEDFYTSNKVDIQGFSTGLVPKVEKLNDTLLQLTFLGNALNHQQNDDLNVDFILKDQAFSSGDTALIFQTEYQDIYLNFKQPTVLYQNTHFIEDSSDIGVINTAYACTITLDSFGSDSFNGNIGEDLVSSGKATVTSLPNGLIPRLEIISQNELELRILDTAFSHSTADNTYFELNLEDNAFSLFDAVEFNDSYYQYLYIKFIHLISIFDDHYSDPQILIFPNPTSSELHIKCNLDENPQEIVIYDLFGKTLFKQVFKEIVDVSSLPAGQYVMSIKHNKNHFIHKIVIN